MLERIEHRGSLRYEEMLFEAAAVLAGTVLMGSRVSGNRPESHDSSVTLSSLVQQIAVYRDAFYDRLLGDMEGRHAERLRAEAVTLRQPFGGVRQHFNQHLARRRAEQLQHVHLAELFARMGYTEAAQRQARVVPVASARLKCDIHCRLTTAHLAIEEVHGAAGEKRAASDDPAARLVSAAALLEEATGILHRAIECGALADPWNILGFGGQYSLFPSPENSVYDHRIDELIGVVGSIFTVGVQIQKEAAALGVDEVEREVARRLETLADWWDKYATTEVSSVESFSGRETCESADHVASALRAWHEAAQPRAIWPFGGSGPSSSARPRPMPWWSTPSWSNAAPWPRWPSWSSGSARRTRSRWPRRTIRFTTWRWTGCMTCGTMPTTRSPAPARRRSSDGRWPANSSITWRPTPRSIGRSRGSTCAGRTGWQPGGRRRRRGRYFQCGL